jgi:uncharacterized protein (TIRG00374 family)
VKRKLQVLIGILLGAVIVWLLFRDTDWAAVMESMRGASIAWLLVSQIPIFGSFVARVIRWRYIVRAIKPVPFSTLFNATQIGFLANFLLPLRAGEVIRAFILSRRAAIPFSKSVALVALDRVTDLFGAGACMLVTILAFDMASDVVLPPGTLSNPEPIVISSGFVEAGAIGMAAALVIVVAALVVLYANRQLVLRITDLLLSPFSKKLAAHVQALVQQFAEGLHVFRSAGDMLKSVAWSLATWGCFVLSGVCMLEAFHFDYPWHTTFLLQTLLALAVSVPGAPGFVGQFHLAVVVTLLIAVPGASVPEAKAAAIVMHLLNLLPVVVAGIWSLMAEQAGLLELTRRSVEAEAALDPQPAPGPGE